MFFAHLLAIPSGAISEVRDALRHMAEETEKGLSAVELRLENLEFKAEEKAGAVVSEVKDLAEDEFSGMQILEEHVGMTFEELVYALRYPFRKAQVLNSIAPNAGVADLTATGSMPPGASSSPTPVNAPPDSTFVNLGEGDRL